MKQDSAQTIMASLGRFFSGTLLSRITGLGREVVMAAAFGTSPVVASFWMAFRFAHLLRRLFGEGALHVAFVPHFEQIRKQDPKQAAHFFYNLSSTITFLLLSLTIIVELLLAPFVAQNDVVRLTMILLPALVFICLHALNTSLLQCEERFFLPSVSPAILNLIWMATVILFWKSTPSTALQWLSIILVFAFALQWFVTWIPAARFLKSTLGNEIPKKEKGKILALLRPFLLGMLGVAATQINSGLDTIFAKIADPEGPAILWYALRLQQLPLALLGVGLSGALLPPISRAMQSGQLEKAKEFLHFSITKIATLMIPITACIFALGLSGVNLVYGRGQFSAHSVYMTTDALWAYSAGLFPMTLTMVFAASFFAMKNYKIPTILSLSSVALNTLLNAYFVYGLQLGAISIAYATSVAAFFNAIALGICLRKKIGPFAPKFTPFVVQVSLCSLCAFLATFSLTHLFLTDLAKGFLAQMGHLSLEGALFLLFLLIFSYLFKVQTIFSSFLNQKLIHF